MDLIYRLELTHLVELATGNLIVLNLHWCDPAFGHAIPSELRHATMLEF